MHGGARGKGSGKYVVHALSHAVVGEHAVLPCIAEEINPRFPR